MLTPREEEALRQLLESLSLLWFVSLDPLVQMISLWNLRLVSLIKKCNLS
jgi:predicted transcriptional regulator